MTKYIIIVAQIVIFQLSFQEVTTSSTFTCTECVPAELKTLLPVVTTFYTVMGACTLLVWPITPTNAHNPSPTLLDHSLMEEPMVVWLELMYMHWNTPNDMQILQELARHQLMHFHL